MSESIDSVGHCVVRGARREAICHRCRSAVSRLHFLIVAWGLYLLVCYRPDCQLSGLGSLISSVVEIIFCGFLASHLIVVKVVLSSSF